MDECTYRSITGLTNYYGFKSALKNSNFGRAFSCSDETIVFNRVVSGSSNSLGVFTLNTNQVAVIISAPVYISDVATNIFWATTDLQGDVFAFIGNSAPGVIGTVDITATTSQSIGIVFAIFDLL